MAAPPRGPAPLPTSSAGWQPPTELELLLEQIDALDGWRRTRDPVPGPGPGGPGGALTREQRLDRDRDRQARLRERDALLSCLDRQLAGTRTAPTRPRAVLAHRNAWFRGRLAAALHACRIDVVVAVEDGAEALGSAVAEQPEVVLVQERLPSLSGLQVLSAAAAHARRAVLAVQVAHPEHAAAHLAAGAHVVVGPSLPADEVAQRLLAELRRPRPA